MHMVRSGKLSDKRILILDKDAKTRNDRTWSFWETSPGPFESVVYRRWSKTWFHSQYYSRLLDLGPYEYKMIRGIDFYQYCMDLLGHYPNVEIRQAEVKQLRNNGSFAEVETADQLYQAEYVFNSILFDLPVISAEEHFLWQHFRGWVIETEEDLFNPEEATLMDFRTAQDHGTTFVYVKPFSARKALVEYTLFTADLLGDNEYDEGLKDYISRILGIGDFTVSEVENGRIPMTNHRFPVAEGRILHIGTAGGQTKPSSGYTFRFIQKHSERLVNSLVKKGNPFISRPGGPRRFRFYDSTLLRILRYHKLPGDRIFSLLFQKNEPQRVLRFLDNETNIRQELGIISSLPTWPFLKAALKEI